MKNTIALVACLLILSLNSNAQMILEHTYPNGSNLGSWARNAPLEVVNLLVSGKKYVQNDMINKKVYVYNLDFSLWKTINLPSVTNSYPENAYYISENLFKIDGKVDMVVLYTDTITNAWTQLIIDETGATLNTLNNCMGVNVYNVNMDTFKAIVTHPLTYAHHVNQFGFEVYALPGKLPCNSCNYNSGTAGTPADEEVSGASLSEPSPNPSNGSVVISYTLPQSYSKGEIAFYNISGQKVKSYTVYNNTPLLMIDNLQLPSGTYYYYLITNGISTSSKKMIIIK